MRPWDYHPDFTQERLVAIAQLLARGRANALDRHDPDIGDDNWTLGVRAFNCGRHEVARAAGQDGFEWLRVADRGLRFLFRVGDVTMRFYHGKASAPKANMLRSSELEQFHLPFGEGVSLAGMKFRIAVETGVTGDVLQVCFIAISGVETETVWPIPLDLAPPLIVEMRDDLPQEEEIAPAEFSFPDEDGEDSADQASEG